jgi:hypothetical protein
MRSKISLEKLILSYQRTKTGALLRSNCRETRVFFKAYEEVAGTMKNILPTRVFLFQNAGRLKNNLPAK